MDTWAQLWKQVSCLPNFQRDLANRVFVDVMNEPDSMNIRWEARDGRPGAQQLYLGVADALWALSPSKVLFMFEGAHVHAPLCCMLQNVEVLQAQLQLGIAHAKPCVHRCCLRCTVALSPSKVLFLFDSAHVHAMLCFMLHALQRQ